MKRMLSLLALVLGWSVVCAAQEPAAPTATADLTVMTYNLRFASTKAPNAWPDRRPVMKESIRAANPDVIGTQEGVYAQLRDIEADLAGDFAWIGLGRDGGSRGEFMAVFYRKDRLEPLEYDHFWLSDTPAVIGSVTWGHTVKRMATWVRFLDRKTNKQFYFWNTHFDHQVQPAREKSAALIRQRIEGLNSPLPLILLGDFHATAKNNKAYDVLTQDGFLTDTWTGEEQGTFHNFTGNVGRQGRIDWILVRNGIKALSTEVQKFERGGQYPSDHFAVVARLRF